MTVFCTRESFLVLSFLTWKGYTYYRGFYITKEDVSFRSPSTAAAFVSGNVSNGFRVWKVEKSIDLGKYRENKKNGRH